MGQNKTTNTTTSTPSPMEEKLNEQRYNQIQQMDPYTQRNFAALSNAIYPILTGGQQVVPGVSGVSDQQVNNMVQASLRDVMPQFQSAGILDSGMAAQGAFRTAADIRNQNAQFNVSANQNLFNLAAGGQSNLQGQQQGATNSLAGSLAGLRTVTSTQKSMNPFLYSFQNSLGQSLGSGTYGGVSYFGTGG